MVRRGEWENWCSLTDRLVQLPDWRTSPTWGTLGHGWAQVVPGRSSVTLSLCPHWIRDVVDTGLTLKIQQPAVTSRTQALTFIWEEWRYVETQFREKVTLWRTHMQRAGMVLFTSKSQNVPSKYTSKWLWTGPWAQAELHQGPAGLGVGRGTKYGRAPSSQGSWNSTHSTAQRSAAGSTEFMVHQASLHPAFSLEKVKRERRGWCRSWRPQLFWEQEGQSQQPWYMMFRNKQFLRTGKKRNHRLPCWRVINHISSVLLGRLSHHFTYLRACQGGPSQPAFGKEGRNFPPPSVLAKIFHGDGTRKIKLVKNRNEGIRYSLL